MFDAELVEWRIVDDHEWTSTRGYGNERGWRLLCELISAPHDDGIADAKDKEATREPFYINDATYVNINTATSAQTRPMIKEGFRRWTWLRVKSEVPKRYTHTPGDECCS